MRDHTKLRTFELAEELVVFIYRSIRGFPDIETYGLTSQFRRVAVSIPSNLVEGCARNSKVES